MLPTMFGVNWLLGLGEEAKNRFSRWLPWRPPWISARHDFSYFWFTSHQWRSASVFNTSHGTWQMFMHEKPCLIPIIKVCLVIQKLKNNITSLFYSRVSIGQQPYVYSNWNDLNKIRWGTFLAGSEEEGFFIFCFKIIFYFFLFWREWLTQFMLAWKCSIFQNKSCIKLIKIIYEKRTI